MKSMKPSSLIIISVMGGATSMFLFSFIDLSVNSVILNILLFLASSITLLSTLFCIHSQVKDDEDTTEYKHYYRDRLPSSCKDMILREERELELQEDYLDYLADKESHDSCEDERITEELENYR